MSPQWIPFPQLLPCRVKNDMAGKHLFTSQAWKQNKELGL
jgi:hypothetical protein